jgi:predicted TIM-barrel fold metal-dependent hydrolase
MSALYSSDIIDGHHHIWRLADLPWLQAKVQRKIFGDAYQPMQRDYLIKEYLEDCVPSRVVASVFVQANWPSQNSLEEVAWVQSVADRHGFPQAIVGYVDLSDPDRERLIDQQLKFANLRGIRQQIFWHQSDASYRFGTRSDLMKDRHWRSGMELLADRNLPFELQVFPEQMDDAADLARDNSRTQFVLVHAGMLENVSTEGWQAWRQGMKKLAACKNVSVKLSGIGTFVRRLDLDLMKKIYAETISIFGVDRCLFGSNFPVEKIWTNFGSLIDAAKKSTAHLSNSEQREIFYGTAKRIYKL